MINVENISEKIKYNEFYKLYQPLNQLNGNNKFIVYNLSINNLCLKIIYIGKLNNTHFFIPLDLDDTMKFIIFNKNMSFSTTTPDLASIFDINIYMNIFIFTKNINSQYLKNTNNYIEDFEEKIFINTLSDIQIIDFNNISNLQ